MPLWFLNIPVELRTLAVFLLGLVIGGQLNRGIYRLAWDARLIGPWSKKHDKAPPRKWSDYLPVIGWLGLARERELHGRGYWVRPLLIEVATGLGLAALYWLEVHGQLVPPFPWVTQAMLHQRFVSHAVLICLMVVATFIDFDEKTIPDWITIPGALAGLLFAAVWPHSLPMNPVVPLPVPVAQPPWLILTAPNPWSPRLDGWEGLTLGLACFLGWCFAIEPRKPWSLRRQIGFAQRCGGRKAAQYLWARTFRYAWLGPSIALVCVPLILLVWWNAGAPPPPPSMSHARWEALLSMLAGLGFGGALLWAVRVIGSNALGREAMGFGDVTLMAMIGAFLGWQGALVVFFLAPFAALGIAIVQWLITRRHDIAFGPYLCVGALYALVRWPDIWTRFGGAFILGWFIPAIVVFCLILMWAMLAAWSWLRGDYVESDDAAS